MYSKILVEEGTDYQPALTATSATNSELDKTASPANANVDNHSGPGSRWSWRNLLPSHFGEFFELFAFLMHSVWHHQLETSIESLGEEIDKTNESIDELVKLQHARPRSYHDLHRYAGITFNS